MDSKKRKEARERAGYKCERCGFGGDKKNPLTIHHKKPKCHGGTDDPNNIEVLCWKCHCIEHKRKGYPQPTKRRKFKKRRRK